MKRINLVRSDTHNFIFSMLQKQERLKLRCLACPYIPNPSKDSKCSKASTQVALVPVSRYSLAREEQVFFTLIINNIAFFLFFF